MTLTGKDHSGRWSPAHGWALAALICAGAVIFVAPPLAMLPLAVYAGICCLAPFFPHWSWYLPVISHGSRQSRAVALTFDDGPDPATTPALLELLHRHGIRATFFLLGRRAARHPDLVDAILAAGHTVGNHSYSHAPWLMLRSSKRLSADIVATQRLLAGHGVRPRAFRPPVGITNPLLGGVLRPLDLIVVNFSRRAYDLGNRRLADLATKLLRRVRPGDILLLHDAAPPRPAEVPIWLAEVERVLAGLANRQLMVVPLEDLIDRKIMDRLGPGTTAPAETGP
ncbi:MAG: polysaccharide deacetylase family protein [Desulfosarcinaceae bacterium]|nr:polysaccharide deacetylase family protein [Desulfosarcinaceae bacterium]